MPCIYTVSEPSNIVGKARKRLVELKVQVSQTRSPLVGDVDAVPPSAIIVPTPSPQATAVCIDNNVSPPGSQVTPDDVWIEAMDIRLTQMDKTVISDGGMLMDQHINSAQRIIHQQFPQLGGLRSTLLQSKPFKCEACTIVQIFHVRGNHWITAASQKGKVVKVYDTLYASLDQPSAKLIQNMFQCSACTIKIVPAQKQVGGRDCGLFAIANATSIAFGTDPSGTVHEQLLMPIHLIACLTQKTMSPFPQ